MQSNGEVVAGALLSKKIGVYFAASQKMQLVQFSIFNGRNLIMITRIINIWNKLFEIHPTFIIYVIAFISGAANGLTGLIWKFSGILASGSNNAEGNDLIFVAFVILVFIVVFILVVACLGLFHLYKIYEGLHKIEQNHQEYSAKSKEWIGSKPEYFLRISMVVALLFASGKFLPLYYFYNEAGCYVGVFRDHFELGITFMSEASCAQSPAPNKTQIFMIGMPITFLLFFCWDRISLRKMKALESTNDADFENIIIASKSDSLAFLFWTLMCIMFEIDFSQKYLMTIIIIMSLIFGFAYGRNIWVRIK